MHFFPFCGRPSFADFKLSAVSILCADAKTSKATHFSGISAAEPGTLDTKEGEKDAGYFSYRGSDLHDSNFDIYRTDIFGISLPAFQ